MRIFSHSPHIHTKLYEQLIFIHTSRNQTQLTSCKQESITLCTKDLQEDRAIADFTALHHVSLGFNLNPRRLSFISIIFKNSTPTPQTVKYADDLVLMAKEETVLQGMIYTLIETGRYYGMEMNVEITKVMRISIQPFPVTVTIDQKQLENVKCFKYIWVAC